MLSQRLTNPVLPGQIGNPGTGGGNFFSKALPAGISMAFLVGAIVFFAMLIFGAIQWISSGGDKQALEGARGKISNALIGIIILFAAFAIIRVLETFFHISILTLDIQSLIIQ
ncbi:MAG TPA: hypothetical protein VJ227_03925 [Patescibacteria group bacterium]|nr:hypothetical protein [Patescibacteria group bacterium]